MSYKALKPALIVLCACMLTISLPALCKAFYNLPPMASPDTYGNILINRVSEQEDVLPVSFSHWSHRRHFTCEVCHTELEFNMVTNSTEITHEEQEQGRYCGACHDGRKAFSHQARCFRCHNNNLASGEKEYVVVFSRKPFPTTAFGNEIDWVESLRRGLITPRRFLNVEPFAATMDRTVELVAEVRRIPPAYFPHQVHLEWMSCDTCHPALFNIKKKGTKNFSMSEILKGNFCGACHLNVAFPINDCNRCHPKVRRSH